MQILKMRFCKYLSIVLLALISACSAPYIEHGFNSESDFLWAKNYNLTPSEVKFGRDSNLTALEVAKLRGYNISDKKSYDFIKNEMSSTGYNKEFPQSTVFDYLYIRPEALRNNRTVREHLLYIRKTKEKERMDSNNAIIFDELKQQFEQYEISNKNGQYITSCSRGNTIIDRLSPIVGDDVRFQRFIRDFKPELKISCNKAELKLLQANKFSDSGFDHLKNNNYAEACNNLTEANTILEGSIPYILESKNKTCVFEHFRLAAIVNSDECQKIFKSRNSCATVSGDKLNYEPCMKIKFGYSYTKKIENQCLYSEIQLNKTQYLKDLNKAIEPLMFLK